ncbi:MAG: hypothetical protein LQ340_005281 [Diploschistes diacapsis]|nr:MAG: hypothetical protein LQ340_005281 [Diploschistes diacapsis]
MGAVSRPLRLKRFLAWRKLRATRPIHSTVFGSVRDELSSDSRICEYEVTAFSSAVKDSRMLSLRVSFIGRDESMIGSLGDPPEPSMVASEVESTNALQ